ncbi:hypothetical protein ACTXIU_17170, partial [Glutamicibacter arilaitensis]|uniref:hypothetical protein n=2 Tax=Glutamicibacter arilaitensis TaxID=256701 RepID=UPI003FD30D9E
KHKPTKEKTMTSKTFKSEVSHGRLSISDTRNGLFTVAVRRSGESVDMIDLKTETAPALALAILEAAIPKGQISVSAAMADSLHALRDEVKRIDERNAAVREQAELEAEALKLWLACRAVSNKYQTEDIKFSDLDAIEQAEWLAVARKAREIGAEK